MAVACSAAHPRMPPRARTAREMPATTSARLSCWPAARSLLNNASARAAVISSAERAMSIA